MLTRFKRRRRQNTHYKQETSLCLPADSYKPVSPKAEAFHSAPEKVRFLPGGNRSGKSYTGSKGGALIAQNTPNGTGVAITNTYKAIGKYLWPRYKTHLAGESLDIAWGRKQLQIPEMVRLRRNNFRIYFSTYEQGRENQQGDDNDFVHFDEEAPEDIYKELYRSTLDRRGKIIYTMTFLQGQTFTYKEIYQKAWTSPYIWSLREPMTLLENPYIPQEEKDAFIDMLSEEDRQMRVYGRCINPEGLVYKEFNPNTHVIDPFPIPDDWTFYRGLDFGWNHPTVSLIGATDGDTMYVISEYYKSGVLEAYHAEQMERQHEDIILKSGSKIRPFLWTVADHDRQEREEYDALGIYSDPAKKAVIQGISRVRNLLHIRSNGKTRLYVFRHCEHTIEEFRLYAYPGKDRKGRLKEGEKADHPIKENDHCMDPLRYITVEAFGYEKTDYNIETA